MVDVSVPAVTRVMPAVCVYVPPKRSVAASTSTVPLLWKGTLTTVVPVLPTAVLRSVPLLLNVPLPAPT